MAQAGARSGRLEVSCGVGNSALAGRSVVIVPDRLRTKFRNECTVCSALRSGYARRQRTGADFRRNGEIAYDDRGGYCGDKSKLGLSSTNKLEIDFGQ